MAITINVYPYFSPRVIEVTTPQTTASLQEIVDAVRAWEDSNIGQHYERLIDPSGKEDLGGAQSVGITASLNNAQLIFTNRTSPLDDGTGRTCDQTDATGTVLYVNDADFITDGVYRGSTVQNTTTGEISTVMEVTDQYTLKMLPLSNAGGLGWTLGDGYIVYENIQCTITGGNLVAVDNVGASIPPIVPTVGTHVINSLSSSGTLVFQGGGVGNIEKTVFVDTTEPINGDGTAGNPFNNIGDTIDFAEANGIKTITVFEEVTLDRNLKNFIIKGVGHPVINCGGRDLKNSEFQHCTLRGTYVNSIIAISCVLDNNFSLNGTFENCGLNGDLISVDGGTVVLVGCYSTIPGLARPSVSLNSVGTSSVSIRNMSGGLNVKDVNAVTDVMTIEMSQGKVTLENTCTDGVISVRGLTHFEDNSNGSTIDSTALAENLIWDKDISSYTTDGQAGLELQIARLQAALAAALSA